MNHIKSFYKEVFMRHPDHTHSHSALNTHDAQPSSSRDPKNQDIQPLEGACYSEGAPNVALDANSSITIPKKNAMGFLQQWKDEVEKEKARNKEPEATRELKKFQMKVKAVREELIEHYKKPDADKTVEPILAGLRALLIRSLMCPHF